jgi:hypothetical protein
VGPKGRRKGMGRVRERRRDRREEEDAVFKVKLHDQVTLRITCPLLG